MSISSVNGDPREDCPVRRSEIGEFSPWGRDGGESPPRNRFGDEDGIASSAPRRLRP
jgi:hypothetical protein